MNQTKPKLDDEYAPHKHAQVDYFCTSGYKKLALMLIKGAVVDLLSSNDQVKNDAAKWINYRPDRDGPAGHGLSFDLCVELSDLPVQMDAFATVCLEEPKKALKQLSRFHELRVAAERGPLVSGLVPHAGEGPRGVLDSVSRWIFGGPVDQNSAPASKVTGG